VQAQIGIRSVIRLGIKIDRHFYLLEAHCPLLVALTLQDERRFWQFLQLAGSGLFDSSAAHSPGFRSCGAIVDEFAV
jgi:hypothetical protein